ncbi:MAG: GxxExxY protein [bacterium]
MGVLRHGEITGEVLRLFYRVHGRLGFGVLESVCCNALGFEFTKAGLAYQREVPIEVRYDGVCIGVFRADFLVAECVIVEAKACEVLNDAHRKQLTNYMRSCTLEVGLLLHFGVKAKVERILYTSDRKPDVYLSSTSP